MNLYVFSRIYGLEGWECVDQQLFRYLLFLFSNSGASLAFLLHLHFMMILVAEL
jgi:hypothetical protein